MLTSINQLDPGITSLGRENARKQRQLLGLELGLRLGLSLLAGLLLVSAGQYRALRGANTQLHPINHTVNDKHARTQEPADRLTLLRRELNHRVQNNLAIVGSLLNLQSGSLVDAQVARAVREGRPRVAWRQGACCTSTFPKLPMWPA